MSEMRVVRKELAKLMKKYGSGLLETSNLIKRKDSNVGGNNMNDYTIGDVLMPTRKDVESNLRRNIRENKNNKNSWYYGKKVDAKTINQEARNMVRYSTIIQTNRLNPDKLMYDHDLVKLKRETGIQREIYDTQTTNQKLAARKQGIEKRTTNRVKQRISESRERGVGENIIEEVSKMLNRYKRNKKKYFNELEEILEMLKNETIFLDADYTPGSP